MTKEVWVATYTNVDNDYDTVGVYADSERAEVDVRARIADFAEASDDIDFTREVNPRTGTINYTVGTLVDYNDIDTIEWYDIVKYEIIE
jgi:hypothetical protein